MNYHVPDNCVRFIDLVTLLNSTEDHVQTLIESNEIIPSYCFSGRLDLYEKSERAEEVLLSKDNLFHNEVFYISNPSPIEKITSVDPFFNNKPLDFIVGKSGIHTEFGVHYPKNTSFVNFFPTESLLRSNRFKMHSNKCIFFKIKEIKTLDMHELLFTSEQVFKFAKNYYEKLSETDSYFSNIEPSAHNNLKDNKQVNNLLRLVGALSLVVVDVAVKSGNIKYGEGKNPNCNAIFKKIADLSQKNDFDNSGLSASNISKQIKNGLDSL